MCRSLTASLLLLNRHCADKVLSEQRDCSNVNAFFLIFFLMLRSLQVLSSVKLQGPYFLFFLLTSRFCCYPEFVGQVFAHYKYKLLTASLPPRGEMALLCKKLLFSYCTISARLVNKPSWHVSNVRTKEDKSLQSATLCVSQTGWSSNMTP